MALSSLDMIMACQQQGYLSKEATADALRRRQQLIKEAMGKYAINIFKAMRRAPATTSSAVKAEKGGGLLSKLRTGSRTGSPDSAKWSDVTTNLAKMMALAGMTAGATAGLGGLMSHRSAKNLDARVKNSYQEMIKHDTELVVPGDREKTQRNFGVLARYAPSLASEPAVAGPIVKSMNVMEGVNVPFIKSLAETQSRIDDMAEKRKIVRMSPMKVTDFATKAMLAGS